MIFILYTYVNIKGIFPYPAISKIADYGLLIQIDLYSLYPYTISTSYGLLYCLYDQISLPKALTAHTHILSLPNQLHL